MHSNTGLSADQLTMLQFISADVAAAVDPIALAEHVVRELHDRFGYELPSVYLLHSDGTLHLAAQIGYAAIRPRGARKPRPRLPPAAHSSRSTELRAFT